MSLKERSKQIQHASVSAFALYQLPLGNFLRFEEKDGRMQIVWRWLPQGEWRYSYFDCETGQYNGECIA
jgi:hypothetical protein